MLSPEELVNKLKKINWKTLYEEQYGDLSKEEKQILDGTNLNQKIYSENHLKYVVLKNSIKKDS